MAFYLLGCQIFS